MKNDMKEKMMALYSIIGCDTELEFEYPELKDVLIVISFKRKETKDE